MEIIHGDLGLRNCLAFVDLDHIHVYKRVKLVIADFGLASKSPCEKPIDYIALQWAAPETIQTRMVSFSTDVWAVGCVMCEILGDGQLPYRDFTNQKIVQEAMGGTLMPFIDPQWTVDERNFLQSIFVQEERPTIDKILATWKDIVSQKSILQTALTMRYSRGGDDGIATAVQKACQDTTMALLEQLFKKGLQLRAPLDTHGNTAAHCLAMYDNHVGLQIYEKKLNIGGVNNIGRTALWTAAQFNSCRCIEWLNNKGLPVDQADNEGYTPAYVAAQYNHLEALSLLKNYGADLSLPADSGATPAFIASQEGNPDCLQFLVDAGADLDCDVDGGFNAVMCAAYEGHLECLKILSAAGVDLDNTDNDGHTAIYWASMGKHADCVKYLVLRDGYKAHEEEINRDYKESLLTELQRARKEMEYLSQEVAALRTIEEDLFQGAIQHGVARREKNLVVQEAREMNETMKRLPDMLDMFDLLQDEKDNLLRKIIKEKKGIDSAGKLLAAREVELKTHQKKNEELKAIVEHIMKKLEKKKEEAKKIQRQKLREKLERQQSLHEQRKKQKKLDKVKAKKRVALMNVRMRLTTEINRCKQMIEQDSLLNFQVEQKLQRAMKENADLLRKAVKDVNRYRQGNDMFKEVLNMKPPKPAASKPTPVARVSKMPGKSSGHSGHASRSKVPGRSRNPGRVMKGTKVAKLRRKASPLRQATSEARKRIRRSQELIQNLLEESVA